ncbi:MAG TPA: peptidoglycan-binding protein [Stellaceae bacterium]|nr:peptidoglycan-binding protein [Stellaceae bacterium]
MRKQILATASALALGLATCGVGLAAEPSSAAQTPQTAQPSANMPAPSTQSPNATEQGTSTPSPSAQTPNATEPGEHSTAPVQLSKQQLMQVQRQLKEAGLYKGRVDGMMGPETKQAIQAFQQQNGLQQTGTLDQQTLSALNNKGANGSGASMAPGAQPSNAGATGNETNNPSPRQPGTHGNYTGQTQYK